MVSLCMVSVTLCDHDPKILHGKFQNSMLYKLYIVCCSQEHDEIGCYPALSCRNVSHLFVPVATLYIFPTY